MKLKKIKVEQLFGTYDYEIKLNDKELVTILHAPNGMGKTTLLKLVKAIIEGDILYLDETPFKKIELYFNNKEYIVVEKDEVFASELERDLYKSRTYSIHADEKEDRRMLIKFKIKSRGEKLFQDTLVWDRDALLMLYRRVPIRYRENYGEGNRGVTIKDALGKMEMESRELFDNEELFERLKKFQNSLEIHFIQSNRVFMNAMQEKTRVTQVDSIRIYSNELKIIIDKQRKEKEKVSEELDRTFPKRILDIFLHSSKDKKYNEKIIRKKLKELDDITVELEKIGLISENESSDLSNEPVFPQETLPVLDLYVSDNSKKFAVYNEIKEKLERLLDIINNKNGFSNKKMVIDTEDGVCFMLDSGEKVPLEKLSSGEKNDFILFYELIFKCNNNSLILIDEPEISLHIAWQQEFINELLEICSMNNMQAIVATHSPNIVDEHWNLLQDIVELGEVNEN